MTGFFRTSRYFGMYGEQAGTEALLMQLRDAAEVIYPTQYKGLDIITSNLELYKADRMMYDSEADEDMPSCGGTRPGCGPYLPPRRSCPSHPSS